MPRLFLVDTNVVVSGVVGPDAASPPVVLTDSMVEGRLPFVILAELLAEYGAILSRPSIAARHGLADPEIDALLAKLTASAYLRQPPDEDAPDPDDPWPEAPPGDEHVIRLLAHEPHAALVTDDLALADAVRGRREVLTPAALVAELGLGRPGA